MKKILILIPSILFLFVWFLSTDLYTNDPDLNHNYSFCQKLNFGIKTILENSSVFKKNFWGVSIYSHQAKKHIYQYNDENLFRPASVIKLLTNKSCT